MNSLYRVPRGMTKPIKSIALGNPTFDTKKADMNIRPFP